MSQADQPSNVTTNVRRRWIHPSVWLAALPFVALLVYLNWRGELVQSGAIIGFHHAGPAIENPDYTAFDHGWPWTYVNRSGDNLSSWTFDATVTSELNQQVVLLDALIAIAIVVAVVVALEYRHRRRGSLLRFSLLDLVVAMTIVAASLGWFAYHVRRASREREIIARLWDQGCHVHTECRVAPVLSRLLGRDIRAFDRATEVYFEDSATDEQVAAVADGLEQLPDIELVSFGFSPDVTDIGIARVVQFRPLKEVSMGETNATGTSLRSLPNDCLIELDAGGSQFNDDGLASIANQTRLEKLDLNITQVTDHGLRHLRQMRSLGTLCVWETPLSDAAVEELGQLPQLWWLELPRSISPEAVERLKKSLPADAISQW